MTLQLLPSEFPYLWGKFYFIFYQCAQMIFMPYQGTVQFFSCKHAVYIIWRIALVLLLALLSIDIFSHVQYIYRIFTITGYSFLCTKEFCGFPQTHIKIWDCKGAKRRLEVATTDGASMCVVLVGSLAFSGPVTNHTAQVTEPRHGKIRQNHLVNIYIRIGTEIVVIQYTLTEKGLVVRWRPSF